jgi:uncharacterized protein YbjT (DUF2867 family)
VAVVAGATGLVGRAVLNRLLADSHYASVHAVGRRAPDAAHPRLVVHIVSSFAETVLPRADDVFIALGTTIRTAGSREAFRAVDFDAVLALAKAARAAGCTRLGVVSAMGAHRSSAVFYNRVKGEMEAAVSALGFETVVIARPSLLAGDRASLKQAPRIGEQLALHAFRVVDALLPANYRAIDANVVAEALVTALRSNGAGCHVLQSGELQKSAKTADL